MWEIILGVISIVGGLVVKIFLDRKKQAQKTTIETKEKQLENIGGSLQVEQKIRESNNEKVTNFNFDDWNSGR